MAQAEEPVDALNTPPTLSAQTPVAADESVNDLLDELQSVDVEEVRATPPPDPEEETTRPPEAQQAAEAHGGKIEYVERPEDSEVILELMLDDRSTVLDPGLTGYLVDETVLLPLGRMVELLGFPIDVSSGNGTAKGWFISPEKTFSLESPYNAAYIGGKQVPRKTGIAETHLDDIYVSIDLLTIWFPIELTLNYGELRLYMKTLTDLPFQERAKRRSRWDSLAAAQARPGFDYAPEDLIRLPYHMFSAPALEFTHAYTHDRGVTGSTSGTMHSVNAEADLLGMNARLSTSYATSTAAREEIQSTQFTMSKENFDASLLGPLKATRYELGDIGTGTFPLAGSQQGRGGMVTNEPYNFVRDPTQFRISGYGPAGWDVEVFQDGELLAFAEIAPDGKYLFETLPLGEGFNLFKIVLYGPNGEQEERYERFYLGQDMVEKGKFLYNAAFLQSSSPLMDFGIVHPPETPHTLSLIGEYGVSSYLSAMGGFYRAPHAGSVLDGMGFGLRTSGGSTYAQMNTFFDKSGGQSSSVLVTGNLGSTMGFNLRHERHRNYDPGTYSTLATSGAEVSKAFNFKNEIIPDINLSLRAEKEEEETGRDKMSYLARMSTNFLGLSLTNEMERTTFSDASADTHEGRLSARYRVPFGTLRGGLNYKFYQPQELVSGNLTFQTDLTDRLSLTAGIDHSFLSDGATSFNSTLDWKLDRVRLGLGGSIDNKRNKQVNLTLAYNLIPQSLYGDYAFTGRASDVNSGRLLLRPFVDSNGNAAYDGGEPSVDGTVFRNALRGAVSVEAENGLPILSGLSPNQANRITLEEKSVADIYLTPLKKELIVMGKRGVNGPIDFPFTKKGEISGTLYGQSADGEQVPLEEIRMALLDPSGKEVAETWSEYEGYFTFDALPIGTYRILIPATAATAPYYSGDGQGPTVVIDAENPERIDLMVVLDGENITLPSGSGHIEENQDKKGNGLSSAGDGAGNKIE